ncbi:MAG: hypothetical protein AAGB34_07795 [Planctomycetota bacterium]
MSQAVLLYLHAYVTLALVGLIWTIQLVHYPLFLRVPSEAFPDYGRAHMKRISWLVGPLMLGELVTAILLVAIPGEIPALLVWSGLGGVLLIWISTAFVQGPIHPKITDSFDETLHRRLVRTNWFRTVVWTARGVLVLIMLDMLRTAAP